MQARPGIFAFCVLAIAVTVIDLGIAQAAEQSESDAEKAVEILRYAMQCPTNVSFDEGYKTKDINRYTGNSEVFSFSQEKSYFEEEENMKINKTYSAKFSRLTNLENNTYNGEVSDYIEIYCKENSICYAVQSELEKDCLVSGNRIKCNKEGEKLKSGAISTFNICPDQRSNFITAFNYLVQRSSSATPIHGYHVTGLPLDVALPIRQRPGRAGRTIGGLSSTDSGIELSNCKKVAGYHDAWCEISWGSVQGWVSTTHLKLEDASGPSPQQ